MTDADAMREAKREIRKLKKYLTVLVAEVNLYLSQVDVVMARSAMPERRRELAKLCNALEMAKDEGRFFGLGISFRTGKPLRTPVRGGKAL